MQVILLATDEATRLYPLSDTIPTPLLPIVNRPLIAITSEMIARAGIRNVVLSLCHRGGSIASYCGSGKRWGLNFEYAIQRQGWGTAGALKWAAKLLHETFLVLPGDAVLDLDIEAALAYHRAHGGAATVIVQHAPESEADDCVQIVPDGRIVRVNPDTRDAQTHCCTGAYIFEPHILQFIPAATPYDCFSQLLPALLDAGVAVYGYAMQGYWNPLTSLAAYQTAQNVFLYNAYAAGKPEAQPPDQALPRIRYPLIEGRQIAPGIWVGLHHVIHPNARLAPPVCIGDNCWIGQNAEIGPETILGSNVIVDDEATVARSTILDHTYVGQLVNVTNRIIHHCIAIDPATSEHAQIVDPFLLAETRPETIRRGRIRWVLTVTAAFLLLVLTLPITLPIGLIVFLTTGGRLFRRSLRVGRSPAAPRPGQPPEIRTFNLLAFQTQRRAGIESAFGRWLRQWELDRLPELLNVLKGDLALVGVKPLSPEEVAQLHEEWHQKRSECPAGVTGLWYIQLDPGHELDEVLVADAYYVATRTRRSEILLLLQTPLAWLRRRWGNHTLSITRRQGYRGKTDKVGNV